MVSLRRIEKYLHAAEVARVPPSERQTQKIAFQSCTVTWPQDRASASTAPSAASTPRHKFMLVDLSLDFPQGELSLICGKLGSGKTLLLLALLGEADVLTGQLLCPRSPPDSLASFSKIIPRKDEWIVQGCCAYVPQVIWVAVFWLTFTDTLQHKAAWLRNASIKGIYSWCSALPSSLIILSCTENILFNLPYDEERYQKTLEALPFNPIHACPFWHLYPRFALLWAIWRF